MLYAILTLNIKKIRKFRFVLNVEKNKLYPAMNTYSHFRQRKHFGISHFHIQWKTSIIINM